MLLPLAWRHRLVVVAVLALPVLPVDVASAQRRVRGDRARCRAGTSRRSSKPRGTVCCTTPVRDFRPGFDLGSAVVVPVLRRERGRTLDARSSAMPIMDHVGGSARCANATAGARVDRRASRRGTTSVCARAAPAQGWQWDGVRFRIAASSPRNRQSDNDSSCVLRIEQRSRSGNVAGRHHDAAAKSTLPTRYSDAPSIFSSAAHHGSRSSSRRVFVTLRAAAHRGFQRRVYESVRASASRRSGAAFEQCRAAELPDGTIGRGVVALRRDRARSLEWRRHSPPYWRVGIRRRHLPVNGHERFSEAIDHQAQLRDEAGFFFRRQEAADLDALGRAPESAIRSSYQGCACRLDQETREETREAIDALGPTMAFFDDQFVGREGQHFLFVRAPDAEIQTRRTAHPSPAR